MKFKKEELEDFIKDIENTDNELSKEQKIDKILEKIERCMARYPEWVVKPGNDRYYGMELILFKSQMLLVKEALEKLKNENN
jgi:hypothetical protein